MYIVVNNMSCLFGAQVLCSSLVFREDMDVGFVVVGDLHKKCKCLQTRVQGIVDNLKALRETQLHLMYSVMGLEEPSDDIAADIDSARALLHQMPANPPPQAVLVEAVQQAMGYDNDAVPFPTLNIELPCSPERFVINPIPLSNSELTCGQHAQNPSRASVLHASLGPGPWFTRTPSHTLAVGPPGCRTTVSPGRKLDMEDIVVTGRADDTKCLPNERVEKDEPVQDTRSKGLQNTTMQDNEQPYVVAGGAGMVDVSSDTEDDPFTPTSCSLASEVVERDSEMKDTKPLETVPKDHTLDDVLGRTIHKSDGR